MEHAVLIADAIIIALLLLRPIAKVVVRTEGTGFIHVTKCLPERDETMKIAGWKHEGLDLNPYNVQHMNWVEEIERATVTMTNGATFPVAESLAVLRKRFKQAMG